MASTVVRSMWFPANRGARMSSGGDPAGRS